MADDDKEPSGAEKMFGDFAAALVGFTDDVLFGQVWTRPQLSSKERSLVTVACLTTSGNTDQLVYHLGLAKDNGATEEELIEAVTHLAFYAGTPPATSASTSGRTRGSRSPPTRSSGCPPPASAGRTCGPTAASRRSTGRPRWGTSTSASSGDRQRRPEREAGPVRDRLVLRLRQHLRNLPGRLPVPLRAPELMGTIGTQAERARIPLADGTLVATPDIPPAT